MKQSIIALTAGTLFGAGFVLSGMADPNVVLAFLTLGAEWNPQLAFVMAGALVVTLPGFAWMRRRGRPFACDQFQEPSKRNIDTPLIVGSLLFGAGWGLSGYCPGPAIVSTGFLQPAALLFLPAMIVGGLVARPISEHLSGSNLKRGNLEEQT